MKFKEIFTWRGHIRVAVFDLSKQLIEEVEFDNLVMNVGKNMVRDLLGGVITDGDIKYIALGSSNAAVVATQTQLTAEQFRKAITQQTYPSTGQIKTVGYIAPGEGLGFTINELGWFAGAAATSPANSGIMISRVLYNRVKTNLESLQIERTDTFS